MLMLCCEYCVSNGAEAITLVEKQLADSTLGMTLKRKEASVNSTFIYTLDGECVSRVMMYSVDSLRLQIIMAGVFRLFLVG